MVRSIESLMLQQHQKLHKILGECLENLEHSKQIAEELFIKFKWNIEKHFSIEERLIFSHPDIENTEHSEEIEDIIKEHEEILDLVKEIEGDKSSLDKDKINLLMKLIEKHVAFEDEDFYPRLDDILSEGDKEYIIRSSNKVLMP